MKRTFALVAAALAITGCRNDTLNVFSPSELPADVYGSPSTAPTVELPEDSTVYMVRGGRLVAMRRPLQGVASSLPEALLLALLQEPTGQDTRTAVPRDTRINGIEVDEGVATVDVSEEFEQGGSSTLFALRLAQVVYSLTEPPSDVRGVRFAIDGVPTAVVDGEGTIVPGPVTRADYARFAPRASG